MIHILRGGVRARLWLEVLYHNFTHLRGKNWVLAGVIAAFAAACSSDLLVAPTGSTITLSSSREPVALGGDTTVITALVLDRSSNPVLDKTAVVFSVSRGGICPNDDSACKGDTAPSAVTALTTRGIASVRYVSGSSGASVTITARAGSSTPVTQSITLTNRAAPDGSRVVLSTGKATISVNEATTVTGYFYLTNGTPVPDSTRIAFRSDTTLSVVSPIVLVAGGFASTRIIARSKGTSFIIAASGSFRDSIKVVVE